MATEFVGATKLRRAGFVAAALALFAFLARPADADDVKQIGDGFFTNGDRSPNTDELVFMVTGANGAKGAGIAAIIYHSDPNQPADKLLIAFPGKDAWAKFAAIWSKARRAKRPTEAESMSDASNIGSYFDVYDHTQIGVNTDSDGAIDFTTAGKPSDNGSPTVLGYFKLVPRDFKAFDHDVKTISAWFAK